MGTDNLFHKRKAKGIRSLKRREADRQQFPKALIVCEGVKTELHYFSGLKQHYRLNTARIEICNSAGSDPRSILQFAKQRYHEEKKKGDSHDQVFCVFDKDEHDTYDDSMEGIRNALPKNTFVAINSVPCFEYWILVHFEYTIRAFTSSARKSACQQVVKALKEYLPGYQKDDRDIFGQLVGKIDVAKKNAHNSLEAAENASTDNPTTRVHKLVEYLQNIKKTDAGRLMQFVLWTLTVMCSTDPLPI